jgi:hypothetical protein
MADALDPYKVLQVDREAEDEVIQAAYRRLARKYHPDLATGPDAPARMAAINAAWELIGEPSKRAMFDRARVAAARGAVGPTETNGSRASSAGTARPDSGLHRRPASTTPDGSATGGPSPGGPATPPGPPPPETVSRDWTSGRSTVGGGYEPSMRTAEGLGAAGVPPGNASGSVLTFGRYAGWSLGEIARRDIEFLEWLDRAPIGRQYRDEVDQLLRRAGRRRSAEAEATDRRGLFRRR